MELLHTIIDYVLATVGDWGYLGIFLLMLLESSFFPFPSEVVMIPAGYLAFQWEMSLMLVLAAGIGGSLIGALVNYYGAMYLGRPFLLKFGKYFFIKPETIEKMEAFFQKHGSVSTFTGRLIPVVRQYISLPAGLSKMNVGLFSFYTALGAGIWVFILVMLGYILGDNQDLIAQYMREILMILFAGLVLLLGFYYWIYVRTKKELS